MFHCMSPCCPQWNGKMLWICVYLQHASSLVSLESTLVRWREGLCINVCSLQLLVLRLTTSQLLLFKQLRCMIQQKHTMLLWQLLLRLQVPLPSIRCQLMQRLFTRLQSTHRSMTQHRKPTILWQQQQLHLLFQQRCTQHCQQNLSIKHVCCLWTLKNAAWIFWKVL